MSNTMPQENRRKPYAGSELLRQRRRYGRILRPWLLRRSVRVLLDGLCGVGAIAMAYGLRFDMNVPPWARTQMWIWAALLFVLDPLMISLHGGYRATWKHAGFRDIRLLTVRLGGLNALLLLVPLLTPAGHLIPYSVVIVDFLFVLFFCMGVRALRRVDYESMQRLSRDNRILVLGTAETIASGLAQLTPLYGADIVGLVMEDSSLTNRSVHGVRVLGGTSQLGPLIHQHRISFLFLTSANVAGLSEILRTATDFGVAVKLLPSVHDLLDNRVRVSKPVMVEALSMSQKDTALQLGPAVLACLQDKVVLVSGAGGSIGSELARQVSKAAVRKLILLDQDENAVFELLAELQGMAGLMPVIADIRDREALRRVFAHEQPHVVLHAAAYKHVPMMEANPCEAVLNNVRGTRMLAETACEFGAERMVMISSDKAVRPSSIMGATKRLAEVIIQQIARSQSGKGYQTEFACVRFGNVLGSRGSVLPTFLKQIEAGGPLTVTHEEMTRYFMTIPQAVHLVLQAATLASHGHVYMLDMGDPVLIVNFAREIIRLAGLTPDKDIEIRIVGSRPGEKLHEQLWCEDSLVTPTSFEHIFEVFAEDPDPSFPGLLRQLEQAATEHRPESIRDLLRKMPIDYLTQRAESKESMVAVSAD